MRATRIFSSLLFVACMLPQRVSAQDDRGAGLFTEARQLPLVSQSIGVRLSAGEVEIKLVQVFANDGDEIAQADYHLYLPQGGSVTGFGFWKGGEFFAASLKEKSRAEKLHREAASAGRATALMTKEENIHSFSVYPVRAGELKQVETTMRLPVVMEMGKSRVRLPIDHFIGQAPITTTVIVEIESDEPLAGIGVDGAEFSELGRTERWARIAMATNRPLEIWYFEEVPPLLTRADAIRLDDGTIGLQLRVALYDAGAWRSPYTAFHLLVDGSFSMRRRAGALRDVIGRIRDQASADVQVYGITDDVHWLPSDVSVDGIVKSLRRPEAGHGARSDLFVETLKTLGCERVDVRCAVITDPQLDGLAALEATGVPIVILADAHELAYFADQLPDGALTYQLGIDPTARLLGIGDELVLPVLDVDALMQGDADIDLIGDPTTRVPEGGMIRMMAMTDTLDPIRLSGTIAGRRIERVVVPRLFERDTPTGIGVRRGIYRELLAAWMGAYRREPDPALRDRIVEVSLREDIPTALTSLQVDDPKLSLFAIKPGDPLLTVYHQPGLEEVIAWYPFGETRRLVYDDEAGTFTDRFLVPRGWRERLYRIEIFKIFAEGWVERAHAWYQLDEHGPSAQIVFDPAEGIIRIDTGDETRHIGSVTVHADAGEVLSLTPVDGAWMVLADELPEQFTVFVRDRAGNRTQFDCLLVDGELSVRMPSGESKPAPALPQIALPMRLDGHGMSVSGRHLQVTIGERTIRVPLAGLDLRSLTVTSTLVSDNGRRAVVGTAGGDILVIDCRTRGVGCTATEIDTSFEHHPITGLARISKRSLLVGVLGKGLWELRQGKLRRSDLRVGSRFITGMAHQGKEIFIGTAYNGLWRVHRRRAVKTRFPHPHVARLDIGDDGLLVTSGYGRYLRRGRDRFEQHGVGVATASVGSPDLTAAAVFEDEVFVAGFDGGLFRLDGESLAPVELGLTAMQQRINAMAVWGGALWLGTEDGLLRVDRDVCGIGVHEILSGAVHDLASSKRGLAVASSEGLFVIERDGERDGRATRRDFQSGTGSGRFFSVAWWNDRLYAGGMEGLTWYAEHASGQVTRSEGFNAGWVTALLPDGDRLLVGSYSGGVFELSEAGAAPLEELANQWVPPHAMRKIGDTIWIGGIGMAPVQISSDGAAALHIPVRDVNDFMAMPTGGLLIMTSDGLVRVEDDRSVASAVGGM